MIHFPNLPTFIGFNAPTRIEADIFDLDIEREVPADPDGGFYRVQPDPQFSPRLDEDIVFNGAGMTGATFTAHPKTDPDTGNMFGFGYASKDVLTKDMTYYEVDPDGKSPFEISTHCGLNLTMPRTWPSPEYSHPLGYRCPRPL